MLTISKASAGAGKTHKLTGYYLSLLFREYYQGKEKPYRHILAVTFTNKATAEMKDRIIEELDALSSGKESPYLGGLVDLLPGDGCSPSQRESEIRRDAGFLLRSILNDYTGFNVSTIDSFFQMILRAFAREMGQSSSYNVELDTDGILVEAVDSMMASLDESGKSDLLRWLIDMAVDEIEQGAGWDITRKLYGLGSFVFNEQFRMKFNAGEALDREGVARFREKMKEIRRGFERKVSSMASEAMGMISSAGLELTDFAGGSRSGMCRLESLSRGQMGLSAGFVKMAQASEPQGAWYTKTSPVKDVISGLFHSPLFGLISGIHELFTSDEYKEYVTAKLVLRNFSMLGVVNDLKVEIDKWCRGNNSVILSDTNEFLHRIIDREETPFVYEKAATRIDSFMLDEFQDTSAMQWDNFRPLVMESVDNGRENLIVGDVKQSIYRWRNSDWKLLFSQVENEFGTRDLRMDPLGENWRSGAPVVNFNNSFFKWAGAAVQGLYNEECGLTSTTISSIYDDVCQSVPERRSDVPGHVLVNFVPDGVDKGWKEAVLEMLPDRIETLHGNGVGYGDMAILVRTNEEGAMVSDCLIGHGYDIVTEDSLKIASSGSVRKVISVLSYLLHPDDGMSGWLYEHSGISVSGMTDMPLYDLCERIVSCLNEADRTQVAFLQAFLDCVKDYVAKTGSDLGGFLKWWGECGVKLSISAPEGASSIRVMTIHKSKGLGMKAVIVPFLNGELFRSRGVIWCTPRSDVFRDIGVIPVNISKEMLDSCFRQDYLDERLYQYIDNLNMAYVAFTRAANELHVFAPMPKDSSGLGSVSKLLYAFLCREMKMDGDCYEAGEWYVRREGSKSPEAENRFGIPDHFDSVPGGDRIRISLRNVDKMSESASSRLHGIIMHDIFAAVRTADDVEDAVDDAVLSGDISASERETVLAEVRKRLAMAAAEGFRWFDGSCRIICEVPVLSPGGVERRPDRVMVDGDSAVVVDYKFGAEHSPAYRRQVSDYMKALRAMGYSHVKGYLWYNEGIEEVV